MLDGSLRNVASRFSLNGNEPASTKKATQKGCSRRWVMALTQDWHERITTRGAHSHCGRPQLSSRNCCRPSTSVGLLRTLL